MQGYGMFKIVNYAMLQILACTEKNVNFVFCDFFTAIYVNVKWKAKATWRVNITSSEDDLLYLNWFTTAEGCNFLSVGLGTKNLIVFVYEQFEILRVLEILNETIWLSEMSARSWGK